LFSSEQPGYVGESCAHPTLLAQQPIAACCLSL